MFFCNFQLSYESKHIITALWYFGKCINTSNLEETVLRMTNLSKSYGKIKALEGLDLEIGKGQVFGLLGPNGSGKTTTLGIVLGILNAQNGHFEWFNQPLSTGSLQKIGAILEHPNFYPYLNATDNLRITAQVRGVHPADIDRVLALVNLSDRKKHKYQTYSFGMKQRLAIASAMLGNPEVLILDEPTNGLDPSGIAEIRNLILKIAAEGTTIILASHLLDEVQKVCSHVVVLEKGRKLFSGKVDDMLSNTEIIELSADNIPLLETVVKAYPAYISHKVSGNILELKTEGKCDAAAINNFLFSNGIVCSHIFIRRKSLENYFLELVGHNNEIH